MSMSFKPPAHHASAPSVGHQIPPEALKEFRRIYKGEFGEEITLTEATEVAYRVLALYRLIARKLQDEHSSLIQNPKQHDETDRPLIGFRTSPPAS